jgi:hypothetical protein
LTAVRHQIKTKILPAVIYFYHSKHTELIALMKSIEYEEATTSSWLAQATE